MPCDCEQSAHESISASFPINGGDISGGKAAAVPFGLVHQDQTTQTAGASCSKLD